MKLAALAVLLAAAPSWGGPAMSSPSNAITRDVGDGGGTRSTTAANQLTGSAGEEIAFSTSSTANNLLRGGFGTIAYYPGTPTPSTNGGVSASSTTLDWATPGYDGNLGAALVGSEYFVQIASNPTIGNFNSLQQITVTISTSAQAVGKIVGTGVTGLDPNTTYYAQVLLRDNDGDVSDGAAITTATFTSLASPPIVGALEFTSIQWSSATVAWIAPSQLSVSSMSNEGYILQASSNDFGALPPAGAPVISSTTFQVLATTLTVGVGAIPLDLSSTYYFQVGSLNWAGVPNYATFNKLNFQILQSTGLIHLGAIDPSVALSTISTSSMVVTNLGNWPTTIELTASTSTAGNPWGLSTSSDVETAAMLAVWNGGVVPPAPSLFNTYLTTNTVASQASGSYSGGQNGFQLPPGGSVTLWFRFFLPTTTTSTGPETIQVLPQIVYP